MTRAAILRNLSSRDVQFIELLAKLIAGQYLRHRPTARRSLAAEIAQAITVCVETKLSAARHR